MTDPMLAEQLANLRQEFERVQATKRTAEERFGRLDELKASIQQVEGTATSPDKAVTVVSGPGGSIKSVRFTDQARNLSPTQLSEVVTRTIQQAVASSAQEQARTVQEFVPESDVLERVLKTQEEALGQPIDREALAGTADGPSRVQHPDDEPPARILHNEHPAPARSTQPPRSAARQMWDEDEGFTGIQGKR